MRGRSWMAALALAAGIATAPGAPPVRAAAEDVAAGRVKLVVQIRGLGRDGCEIEVKPGHRGCQFRPQVERLSSRGEAVLFLDDVRTTSADRECAVAITV